MLVFSFARRFSTLDKWQINFIGIATFNSETKSFVPFARFNHNNNNSSDTSAYHQTSSSCAPTNPTKKLMIAFNWFFTSSSRVYVCNIVHSPELNKSQFSHSTIVRCGVYGLCWRSWLVLHRSATTSPLQILIISWKFRTPCLEYGFRRKIENNSFGKWIYCFSMVDCILWWFTTAGDLNRMKSI